MTFKKFLTFFLWKIRMSAQQNEATNIQTPTTKRSVGRPRKYFTEQQRLEAKRKAARECYHRNKQLKNLYKYTDGTSTFYIDKNDENAREWADSCGYTRL